MLLFHCLDCSIPSTCVLSIITVIIATTLILVHHQVPVVEQDEQVLADIWQLPINMLQKPLDLWHKEHTKKVDIEDIGILDPRYMYS